MFFFCFYSTLPLKSKSEATKALITRIPQQETYCSSRRGYRICSIQIDNGGEFCNKELHIFFFFETKGIQHQLTVPHHSWQNGRVERAHRSLQEKNESFINRLSCTFISMV